MIKSIKKNIEFFWLLPWYVKFALLDAIALYIWLAEFDFFGFKVFNLIAGLVFLIISIAAFFTQPFTGGKRHPSSYEKWKERCQNYRVEKLQAFK